MQEGDQVCAVRRVRAGMCSLLSKMLSSEKERERFCLLPSDPFALLSLTVRSLSLLFISRQNCCSARARRRPCLEISRAGERLLQGSSLCRETL